MGAAMLRHLLVFPRAFPSPSTAGKVCPPSLGHRTAAVTVTAHGPQNGHGHPTLIPRSALVQCFTAHLAIVPR
jgi:hypothetical protein